MCKIDLDFARLPGKDSKTNKCLETHGARNAVRYEEGEESHDSCCMRKVKIACTPHQAKYMLMLIVYLPRHPEVVSREAYTSMYTDLSNIPHQRADGRDWPIRRDRCEDHPTF